MWKEELFLIEILWEQIKRFNFGIKDEWIVICFGNKERNDEAFQRIKLFHTQFQGQLVLQKISKKKSVYILWNLLIFVQMINLYRLSFSLAWWTLKKQLLKQNTVNVHSVLLILQIVSFFSIKMRLNLIWLYLKLISTPFILYN